MTRILPHHEGSSLRYVLRFAIFSVALFKLIVTLLVILQSTPINAPRSLAPMNAHVWDLYLVTVNETKSTTSPAGASKSLTRFGFGMWGWCEHDAGDLGGKPTSCVAKPFYGLPGCADPDDPVRELDLPANALSPTAFLLIFYCLKNIWGVAIICLALCTDVSSWKPRFIDAGRAIADLLLYPVIIAAGVGINDLADGLEGKIGTGLTLLIVGMVLDFVVVWPCSYCLSKGLDPKTGKQIKPRVPAESA